MASHLSRRSLRGVSLASALVLAAARPAAAVIIDDFSVGPITVTRTGATAATAQQTGLDQNHVLGGARDIAVGPFGGDAGQSLTIDTTARELQFTIATGSGYFIVGYGTETLPLNVDLTADGSDAFLLELAGGGVSLGSLTVDTATGQSSLGGGSTLVEQMLLPDGRVRIKFPFSSYPSGLDFTSVERLQLSFIRLSETRGIPTLLSFITIPEPTAFILAATGTVVIVHRRRCAAPGLRPR